MSVHYRDNVVVGISADLSSIRPSALLCSYILVYIWISESVQTLRCVRACRIIWSFLFLCPFFLNFGLSVIMILGCRVVVVWWTVLCCGGQSFLCN